MRLVFPIAKMYYKETTISLGVTVQPSIKVLIYKKNLIGYRGRRCL